MSYAVNENTKFTIREMVLKMISFKQYLIEGQYKLEIDKDECIKLINQNCKDFIRFRNTPLFRGMSSGPDYLLLHPEAGGRKSANTSNYYTVIFDEVLPKDYPKRSKSIICGSFKNDDYTVGFGSQQYVIIPFDGVKIGVCANYDLWASKLKFKNKQISLSDFNDVLEGAEIWADSFSSIVKDIEGVIAKDDSEDDSEVESNIRYIKSVFKKGEVKKTIFQAYSAESMEFKLINTSQLDTLTGEREVWISGKCIAIKTSLYDEIKNKL